jgi:hypothetical protein
MQLVNLQSAGCDSIERAQRELGSVNFQRIPQPHHYCQYEIDLIRPKKPDGRHAEAVVADDLRHPGSAR